jgi:hypothetical protein
VAGALDLNQALLRNAEIEAFVLRRYAARQRIRHRVPTVRTAPTIPRCPARPIRLAGATLAFSLATAQAGGQELAYEELRETVIDAYTLAQPCAKRVGMLQLKLPTPSYASLSRQFAERRRIEGAEAQLQLARLAFRGECGLARDEQPLRALAAQGDARAIAALRIAAAPAPNERAAAALAPEVRERIDRLPPATDAAPAGARVLARCTGAAPSHAGAPPPRALLAYWATSRLGSLSYCEATSADPNTRAYQHHWPVIVAAWQKAAGRTASGELTAADVQALHAEVETAAAEIARAQRDKELAQQAAAAREAAEAREREQQAQAAEREMASYLSRSTDPQAIYLRAGKYERAAETVRATRLYEFLVDAFPRTTWAVKANDRLLQMRAEAATAVRGAQAQGTGARPVGAGAGLPMPGEDAAQLLLRQQQEQMRLEQERAEEFRRVQESQRRAWEAQMQIERERQQQVDRNRN